MVREVRTIDLEEIRVFVAVARLRGMTAAAAALGVSKSTVSMQISRLEARLGSKLMERTSRRLSLTREGEAVLPRAQSLLADADGLLEEASQARFTPRGIVRIAVSPALGSSVLDRLVPALKLSHPAIALVVVPSYEFGDLQDPAFDFAIRVGHVLDQGLVARRAGSFSRILVCAPNHPAAELTRVADLADAPLLSFSAHTSRVDWRLIDGGAPQETISLEGEAQVAVQDFEILVRLARQGLGVALAPDFLVRDDLAAERLVRVLPKFSSPARDVLFVFRPGASHIGRVGAVLAAAQDAVATVLQSPSPPIGASG